MPSSLRHIYALIDRATNSTWWPIMHSYAILRFGAFISPGQVGDIHVHLATHTKNQVQSRNLQTYTRNIPVMSPWIEASKTLGFENLNVAVPLLPSLARVSLTSGMVFSSTSRMNSILAASRDVRRERSPRRSAGAKAAARGAMVARMVTDFIVSAAIIMNLWRKWLEAGSRRRGHIILMMTHSGRAMHGAATTYSTAVAYVHHVRTYAERANE